MSSGSRFPNLPNDYPLEETMTRIIDGKLEQLRRAPQHFTDVWQGGIFRMPGWIADKGETPFRALIPLWLSVETGAAFMGDLMRPEEFDPARALDTLAEGVLRSRSGGYRPGRLEVNDPALAEYLSDQISGMGIEVSLVERLDLVEVFLRAFCEDTSGVSASAYSAGAADHPRRSWSVDGIEDCGSAAG